jgi:hypothetical protein
LDDAFALLYDAELMLFGCCPATRHVHPHKVAQAWRAMKISQTPRHLMAE